MFWTNEQKHVFTKTLHFLTEQTFIKKTETDPSSYDISGWNQFCWSLKLSNQKLVLTAWEYRVL